MEKRVPKSVRNAALLESPDRESPDGGYMEKPGKAVIKPGDCLLFEGLERSI